MSLACQLPRQFLRVIELPQRFQHAARMDRDVPGLFVGVDEVAHQTVAVAVEVNADQIAGAVQHGLPLLPPIVSAVETKLNGVCGSSWSFAFSQRSGNLNGSR